MVGRGWVSNRLNLNTYIGRVRPLAAEQAIVKRREFEDDAFEIRYDVSGGRNSSKLLDCYVPRAGTS